VDLKFVIVYHFKE